MTRVSTRVASAGHGTIKIMRLLRTVVAAKEYFVGADVDMLHAAVADGGKASVSPAQFADVKAFQYSFLVSQFSFCGRVEISLRPFRTAGALPLRRTHDTRHIRQVRDDSTLAAPMPRHCSGTSCLRFFFPVHSMLSADDFACYLVSRPT